ncbi:hypothetical protein MC885_010817 [Smutsia gigantea]|nr:hypothetical protein MC885_010817 [Smutsia gigantea]
MRGGVGRAQHVGSCSLGRTPGPTVLCGGSSRLRGVVGVGSAECEALLFGRGEGLRGSTAATVLVTFLGDTFPAVPTRRASSAAPIPLGLLGAALSEDNTWEPEENLDCPDLIAEFLQSQKTAHETDKSEGGKRKADSDSEDKGEESKPKKKKEESFDSDPRPDCQPGPMSYRKNSDEADLVPAKEANVKCPQVVISFYEERLTWHSYPSEDDDKKDDKN